MNGLVGDARDLLTANVRLREERDEARAGEAAARGELETVTARCRKVEAEAQTLYELLMTANTDALRAARIAEIAHRGTELP